MAGTDRSTSRHGARLARLSKVVKAVEENLRDAEEARNRAIADAEADGWSYGDLAKACHISRAHAHRICVAENERRQLLVVQDD
jgi:hypothetical protein